MRVGVRKPNSGKLQPLAPPARGNRTPQDSSLHLVVVVPWGRVGVTGYRFPTSHAR